MSSPRKTLPNLIKSIEGTQPKLHAHIIALEKLFGKKFLPYTENRENFIYNFLKQPTKKPDEIDAVIIIIKAITDALPKNFNTIVSKLERYSKINQTLSDTEVEDIQTFITTQGMRPVIKKDGKYNYEIIETRLQSAISKLVEKCVIKNDFEKFIAPQHSSPLPVQRGSAPPARLRSAPQLPASPPKPQIKNDIQNTIQYIEKHSSPQLLAPRPAPRRSVTSLERYTPPPPPPQPASRRPAPRRNSQVGKIPKTEYKIIVIRKLVAGLYLTDGEIEHENVYYIQKDGEPYIGPFDTLDAAEKNIADLEKK